MSIIEMFDNIDYINLYSELNGHLEAFLGSVEECKKMDKSFIEVANFYVENIKKVFKKIWIFHKRQLQIESNEDKKLVKHNEDYRSYLNEIKTHLEFDVLKKLKEIADTVNIEFKKYSITLDAISRFCREEQVFIESGGEVVKKASNLPVNFYELSETSSKYAGLAKEILDFIDCKKPENFEIAKMDENYKEVEYFRNNVKDKLEICFGKIQEREEEKNKKLQGLGLENRLIRRINNVNESFKKQKLINDESIIKCKDFIVERIEFFIDGFNSFLNQQTPKVDLPNFLKILKVKIDKHKQKMRNKLPFFKRIFAKK